MNKSTTISIVIVCGAIAATALISTRHERSKWVTTKTGQSGTAGQVKPAVPTSPSPPNELQNGSPEWEAARVKELLLAEKKAISDADVDLFEKVVLSKVSDQNDPVMVPRWALALAGDMPFDPPPTAEQRRRLDLLVRTCLDHGAWRMRQLAINFCWGKKWLRDPEVRHKIEQMAKSDPATQAKLAAERALEQFDKIEAHSKASGPP